MKYNKTQRYQAFVNEYLKSFNLTKAGLAAGYSEKTAGSQGQRLLKNVEVQQLLKSGSKKLMQRAAVDQTFLIKKLKSLASSNIADVASWDSKSLTLKDSETLTWAQTYAIDSIQKIDTQFGTTLKVKMRNPDAALDMLGRYLAFFDGTKTDGPNESVRSALAQLDEEEGKG